MIFLNQQFILSLLEIHNNIKSKLTDPRVAMNFAINRKLKLPIDMETIISLLFTLDQY